MAVSMRLDFVAFFVCVWMCGSKAYRKETGGREDGSPTHSPRSLVCPKLPGRAHALLRNSQLREVP